MTPRVGPVAEENTKQRPTTPTFSPRSKTIENVDSKQEKQCDYEYRSNSPTRSLYIDVPRYGVIQNCIPVTTK